MLTASVENMLVIPVLVERWKPMLYQRWIDVGPIINFCLGDELSDFKFE